MKEPTRFGGRDLTGRHMGALVETVTAVLNSGEAISPQPAWIAMSISEVECIRLKHEKILREALDATYVQMKKDSTECDTYTSTYTPIAIATQKFEAFIESFVNDYRQDVRDCVGEIEGQLAAQVLSGSQEIINRLLEQSRAEYMVNYEKCVNEWLLLLVQVKLYSLCVCVHICMCVWI